MFTLKEDYVKSLNLTLSEEGLVNLEIEAKICCGSESISKPIKFPWSGSLTKISSQLYRTLVFDIDYCNLAIFSSLIIKIKSLMKNQNTKNINEIEKKTIAWMNFRLFDYSKLLKTG